MATVVKRITHVGVDTHGNPSSVFVTIREVTKLAKDATPCVLGDRGVKESIIGAIPRIEWQPRPLLMCKSK